MGAVSPRRAGAAILIACALAGCGSPTPPAKRPPGADAGPIRLGVQVRELSVPQADRLARGGARLIRTTLQWARVQPRRGLDYNWRHYDQLVGLAASRRLTVLPVLIGSPGWAAAHPPYPPSPAAVGEFQDFVRAAVARYGPQGEFWRDHPGLRERPIRAWQVWNEPNVPGFWGGPPDPAGYAALLKGVRAAVLDADPHARIVLAGLPRSVVRYPVDRYLADLYAVPGFSRDFDVAAVHAYAGDERGVLSVIASVRSLMDDHGDAAKPIWVTELGWASAGPPRDTTRVKSPAVQANLLRRSVAALRRVAATDRIGTVVWYDLQDYTPPLGASDRYTWHTGLFDAAGRPKPAWQAFAAQAGGRPGFRPLPSK
jgi:hypothetical protein